VRPRSARKWVVTIVITLILTLGGVGAYLYHTGAFVDSTELKNSISHILIGNGIEGIVVDVNKDRVVTLNGTTDTSEMRDAVVQTVRSIKGVKEVSVRLDLLPPIKDTEERLQKALHENHLTEVIVQIDEKRNASLTGTVANDLMIDLAVTLARSTQGVKLVTNQVKIAEIPDVTNSKEPKLVAVERPSRRPVPQPPGSNSNTVVVRVTPSSDPSVNPSDRKKNTCEGIGGIYRLTCTIEGPENYFKCAPDGRKWNHAIPGCDRK